MRARIVLNNEVELGYLDAGSVHVVESEEPGGYKIEVRRTIIVPFGYAHPQPKPVISTPAGELVVDRVYTIGYRQRGRDGKLQYLRGWRLDRAETYGALHFVRESEHTRFRTISARWLEPGQLVSIEDKS